MALIPTSTTEIAFNRACNVDTSRSLIKHSTGYKNVLGVIVVELPSVLLGQLASSNLRKQSLVFYGYVRWERLGAVPNLYVVTHTSSITLSSSVVRNITGGAPLLVTRSQASAA